MYLFSRQIQIGPGRTRDAQAWVAAMTEKVNQITGLPVGLFQQVYSPEVGTIVWSTFIPDLATLEAAGDKLNVDDAFIALSDQGVTLVTGGATDTLAQLISGEPDPNRQIEYATVVRAVCATGNVGRGLEVGVEIAQRAEKITGTPTLFAADVTGNYGGVAWLSGHANAQAMEAAQQALAADTSWVKFLDKEVGGVYNNDPSVTQQRIFRRLA